MGKVKELASTLRGSNTLRDIDDKNLMEEYFYHKAEALRLFLGLEPEAHLEIDPGDGKHFFYKDQEYGVLFDSELNGIDVNKKDFVKAFNVNGKFINVEKERLLVYKI